MSLLRVAAALLAMVVPGLCQDHAARGWELWKPDAVDLRAYIEATRTRVGWNAARGMEGRSLGVAFTGPQWTPDGASVSFAGPRGEGIGVVRFDGGNSVRWLSREPLAGYKHAWSPDGTRVACRVRQPQAGLRRYAVQVIVAADGRVESTSAVLTDAQPPQWQRGPQGMRWICQEGPRETRGPWLPCALKTPAPAAPGPPLLIFSSQKLHRKSGDGALQPLCDGMSFDPVWSADASCVVFDTQDRIGLWQPASNASPVVLCPGQQPSFSPDGQWIVYQLTGDHTHATDDLRTHTADTLPHLHDDKTNHRIVESDLWIVSLDGSRRLQLTRTPDTLEVEPQWSPDGKTIVCRTEGDTSLLMFIQPQYQRE